MPDRVSFGELQEKIRARGEIRTVYVPPAELKIWINDSIRDLYDQLISANQDTFVKCSPSISVTSDRDVYDLPEDFAALRRVEALYGGVNDWRGLEQYSFQNRSNYNLATTIEPFWRYREMGGKLYLVPIPTTGGSIRAWYIPVPPRLTEDGDEADFIFGWDEYVVLDCLVKHAQKEESDSAPFLAKQSTVLDRILGRAKVRNYGEPNRIRDVAQERYLSRYPWGRTTR